MNEKVLTFCLAAFFHGCRLVGSQHPNPHHSLREAQDFVNQARTDGKLPTPEELA